MSKIGRCDAVLRRIFIVGMFVFLQTQSSHAAESYTFGLLPHYEQRHLFAVWKPVLIELQRRTGLSFKPASMPTLSAFGKEFIKGAYDFAYVNPYYVLKANQSAGYLPLIRDRSNLYGILLVRKDSPAKTLSDLNGKEIAFPTPNAFAACLIMRADFLHHHVSITPKFVTSHNSVYLHVAKGLVAAGGGSNKTLKEQDPKIRDTLRILYTTRPVPSYPVVVHPRVPRAAAEKVRRALLEMAATPEGRELLARVPMEQPVSASLADYAPIKNWGLEKFWVED